MNEKQASQSNCPIASAMGILGEGWTLLVLREAFLGTRRFGDFQRELGVARNILTTRLKKLVDSGLMTRRPSRDDRRVVEYRLTDAGRGLFPVLVAVGQWAGRWLCDGTDGCHEVPVRFLERTTGEELPEVAVRNAAGETLGLHQVILSPGPGADEAVKARYRRAAERAAELAEKHEVAA